MSDIVFLRAWIAVDLPKFYNPVTNLLAPAVRPPPRELKPGHLAAEVSWPSSKQAFTGNSFKSLQGVEALDFVFAFLSLQGHSIFWVGHCNP